MRTLGILMCGLFIAVPMIVHSEPPPSTELKPGDTAPDFTLVGSDGVTYKLSEFRDRQVVVLAWYPKAFTPGCTAENTSLARDGAAIRAHNTAYFTASCDTVEVNTRFGKSLKINFPILSDPQGTTARAYGVVDDGRPVPRRWTFTIGTDGRILHIDKNVQCPTHGVDVAAKLKELAAAGGKPK